jgi:hypothetical protein
MSETYEAIEKLGEAADTVDNLIGALQLPLDPRMHVEVERHAQSRVRRADR